MCLCAPPRIPRPPSSTARSGHGILKPEGADGSESERYAQGAGEYGSAPGVTFIKGTVIELDPAGALYAAIGAGNVRGRGRAGLGWTPGGATPPVLAFARHGLSGGVYERRRHAVAPGWQAVPPVSAG